MPLATLRHRVDDDVDGELRVVLAQEALVAPVVVPLAAVVLVAVEHGDAAAALDRLQVVVDDVVAPPVQLVRGLRRTVLELEEAAIDRVRRRQLRQGVVRERRAHLLFERARVEAVDVVVAIVGEEQPAGVGEAPQVLALGGTEAHQLVAGHEEERKGEQLTGSGRDDDFLVVDRDRGVLDDRVEDVGRDLRVVVPVARLVAQAREDEFRGARAPALRARQRGAGRQRQKLAARDHIKYAVPWSITSPSTIWSRARSRSSTSKNTSASSRARRPRSRSSAGSRDAPTSSCSPPRRCPTIRAPSCRCRSRSRTRSRRRRPSRSSRISCIASASTSSSAAAASSTPGSAARAATGAARASSARSPSSRSSGRSSRASTRSSSRPRTSSTTCAGRSITCGSRWSSTSATPPTTPNRRST